MNRKKPVILFIVALGIVALFWWGVYTLSIPREEKTDKWLKEDYKHLKLVVDYLLTSPSDYIYFVDGSGYVYEGYKKAVKDDAVITSVKHLFDQRDYKKIIKTGNTVRFVKWTRFNDYESGICYFSDETPMIDFLTVTTSLSYDKWHYYEADYNEWRLNN